ncbi:MAG TPA: cytochrome C oxidase subunit IV family protein [Longimicrobiales bacterium]
MAENRSGAEHPLAHEEHAHPGAKTYVMIAAILTIITAAEVAVFYVPALEAALAYILVSLSAAKFILVVMFYMHLKFDSKVFSWVFVAPLTLAILMVISLILLFRVLPYV